MWQLLIDQAQRWRQNTKDHETNDDVPENSSQKKKNIKCPERECALTQTQYSSVVKNS